jgi:hypothetical protein
MAEEIAAALVAAGFEGATAAAVEAFFVRLAFAVVLSQVSRSLVKTPKLNSGAVNSEGRTSTVRQPIAPWDIVVGRARKGGILTFIHQSEDKKDLHLIITLAGHVSEEIEEIWCDDKIVALDANDFDIGRFAKSSFLNTTIPGSLTVDLPAFTSLVSVTGPVSEEPDSGGFRFGTMTDVSPAAPSNFSEYNLTGATLTFHSTATPAGNISIEYAKSFLRVQTSLGAEAGQPFPDLVTESGGKWSDTHWQKGHTKLYARLTSSPDIFPTGVPNITAVIRGEKIFDPRIGTTYWSANPALWVAHYLVNATYGLGADYAAEIDEADLISAANACDERVSLATASSDFIASASSDSIAFVGTAKIPETGDGVRVDSTGTLPAGLSAATTYYAIRTAGLFKLATTYANALAGTPIDITTAGSGTHTLTYWDEPRYRVNGVFSTAEKPQDVISRLLAAMAGKAVKFGDRWHIQAGVYYSPTFTLDDGDLRGPVQSQTLLPRTQNANAVKGVFTDPNNNWQPNGIPPVVSASYLAEDGERIWMDVDLSAFVTSGTQAQRLAKIELLRTRQSQSFSSNFSLAAWRARCGMTVGMTNAKRGWSAKPFEVISSRFIVLSDQALGIELAGRETAAAVFDWSTSEEQAVDLAPNTDFPDPLSTEPPGAPEVVETSYETTGSAGVKALATMTVTAVERSRMYRFAYRRVGDLLYTILPDQQEPSIDIEDLAPDIYEFKCATVNVFGAQSDWSAATMQEIFGLTAAPSNATGFSVIASNGFAVARWDLSPDLDVKIGGRAIVRHSPLTTGATWEDGILISGTVALPGFPGDTIMSPPLPLKTGTYMLKFRDSSGNYSVSMTSFVATEGMVSGFTTLTTITEDSAFGGAKTDVAKVGSAIQLDVAHLALPGTSGNYASTPDTAAISITGDLDQRVRVSLNDWTPAALTTIAGKYNATGNQRSWLLRVNTDGTLEFRWSTDGVSDITKSSTSATGFTNETAHFVRVVLDVNNGAAGNDVKFYTSDDYDPSTGAGTWNQLGTTVTTAGTTSIFNSTAALEVGTFNAGTGSPLSGRAYYAEVLNGIAGTRVAEFDATDFADAGTSAVSSTGETWTINQSGSPAAEIHSPVAAGGVLLSGSYEFTATDDRTTVAIRRFEGTISALSYDIGDLIDGADDWDSAEDIDGGSVNDCNVQLLASVSDDNVTYSPFTPFHVADFSGRYSKFRADFTSANPSHNIAVTELRVAIKVPA